MKREVKIWQIPLSRPPGYELLWFEAPIEEERMRNGKEERTRKGRE